MRACGTVLGGRDDDLVERGVIEPASFEPSPTRTDTLPCCRRAGGLGVAHELLDDLDGPDALRSSARTAAW